MPFFARGDASIYYEERGSGAPLLLLSPGGLNSTIAFWGRLPFNPIESLSTDFHIIAMDQRNAGQSSGPLDPADPWGMYADDQLGLLDHLGIERTLVMGCCIGCSFILKLLERQPERILAGVMEQPIGTDSSNSDFFGPTHWKEWGQELVSRRTDVTTEQVELFGQNMWMTPFVKSVRTELLAHLSTPLLIMPGNDMAHPTTVGLELARVLPNAELLEQWKAPPEIIPQTVAHVRRFLRQHAEAAIRAA